MLSRALYLSAGWFTISLIATLIWGHRVKRGNPLISAAWLVTVLLLGDSWAILTFGIPDEILILSGFAFIFGLIWFWILKDWNALGQVAWITGLLATVFFTLYAFNVTAFAPLNPLSFLVAIIFFFIEALALLMALSHTYESLDASCRIRWRRRVNRLKPRPDYKPVVSIHVPTHNEPIEVVERTLRSLAKLDYPNYEVLVVDNNTPDERIWRPLERMCRELGPNFHCLHLEAWPGYKAGALNFALAQTDPDAEIIGTIDADYQVNPNFLKDLIPAFTHPEIAFVQTPQDYHLLQKEVFSEATYHGYKYFFEVSMPVRNERNAIIFAGTMGLIRKSVLEDVGGWDEWCITEDAETSLRILKRGYQSLYINKSYGRGLMPFTFEGLKKQRFRWCFGGMQILRKHWEALMPWAHWVDPDNKLTLSQRYFYLAGGLGWFTDVLNLLFALFLVLGAVFTLIPTPLQVRPFIGPLMIVPALFLLLHMWRFLWVLRHKLHLSLKLALRTMYNFFALGWAVTLGCIQGLIQKEGVFLRTPKSKSGSKAWQALLGTQWETMIGFSCISIGIFAFLNHPNLYTFFLAGLLAWQSSLYLAAPVYSLLSTGDEVRPVRAVHGRQVFESWAARWALGLTMLFMISAGMFQFLPGPARPPEYARLQPVDVPPERLLGLEQVPLERRALPPTPTETLSASPTPTSSLVVSMPTNVFGTPVPTLTASIAIILSPTQTSPYPSLAATHTPGTMATPIAPIATPGWTATLVPSPTPQATDPSTPTMSPPSPTLPIASTPAATPTSLATLEGTQTPTPVPQFSDTPNPSETEPIYNQTIPPPTDSPVTPTPTSDPPEDALDPTHVPPSSTPVFEDPDPSPTPFGESPAGTPTVPASTPTLPPQPTATQEPPSTPGLH